MRRAGSVLAVALAANGCLERPGSSAAGATSHGPAWDESAAIEVGGRQLVMTGPILHRAAPGAPQVVSRRCYFISLGIGFLVELDAGERARHDGAPTLEITWQPRQLASSSQHCERAFGEGFRLPTSDEAEAWLARNNESGPLFVEDAGRLGTARREVQRCEGSQGCPAAPVEHGSAQPAMLRCVGPLQTRASVVPNETEVRHCVAAFAGARLDDGERDKLRPLALTPKRRITCDPSTSVRAAALRKPLDDLDPKSIVVVGGGKVTHRIVDTNCRAIDNCGAGSEGACAPRYLPNEPMSLMPPAMYQEPDGPLKPTSELTLPGATPGQPWHSQLGHLTVIAVEETDDPVTHDYL